MMNYELQIGPKAVLKQNDHARHIQMHWTLHSCGCCASDNALSNPFNKVCCMNNCLKLGWMLLSTQIYGYLIGPSTIFGDQANRLLIFSSFFCLPSTCQMEMGVGILSVNMDLMNVLEICMQLV